MAKFSPTGHDSGGAVRLLEVDVEPLSEPRWAKIEQAVFARLDLPTEVASVHALPAPGGIWVRRWLPGVAAAVSVLAACLALAVYFLRDASPTLSRITTGSAGSRVALPGIVLDVSPLSAVVVSGNAGESQLVLLDRGKITCDVAHRRPGLPLIVQAGEVRVEVVGTRFSVTRNGEAARVAVEEGVVKVSAQGVTTRVRANESWPPLPVGPKEAAPVLLATPAPPVAALLGKVSAEEARERPVPERHPSVPRQRPSELKNAQKAASVDSAPVDSASADSASADSAPAAPDPQSQFEAAAQLEASSPTRAIQLYQGMESGSSSWARNALFAHGRLEAARGNRAEARRILGQYLLRSPQGPNAEDARLLLQRLE